MRLSELAGTPGLRMRVIGAPLDDRELGWPHITDVADPAPYLTGGELVLTAGVWHTGPESSRRFVAALLARGACGIVFGITPPDSPETPADLIEVCASSELALLEVPPEVPFVAVCKAIAADAAERHEAPLHAAIRRNEELLRAASSGGATALVEVLAREQGLEPFLVDRHGTVLVAGPRRPTSAESRAAGTLTRAETPGVAESEPEPGRRQVSFAIRGMRRTEQRLVCRLGRDEMSPEQHTAVTQAVSFLELEVARDHALRATEARFASELLEIVRAGARRAEEARARLESFGVPSDGPLMVMVVRRSGEEPEETGLSDQLRAALTARGISSVVADSGGATVAFAASGAEDEAQAGLAQELVSELAGVGESLHIGVGRIVGVEDLRRSLLEAWHAGSHAHLHASGPAVATHRDIASHQFLWDLHEDEVRHEFRTQLLGPLVDYDARRGGRLVETLETFLRSGGQWQATAGALTIHVNTLRHRLSRVEELTGRSLARMEDRVDFFLALRDPH